MADVKFSELTGLGATDVASDDVFAIVDTSATTSKKISIDDLFGSIPVDAKIADTTNSTSNTSGALIVSGGVGIAKSVTIGKILQYMVILQFPEISHLVMQLVIK